MIRFARSILSIPTERTHHFLECQRHALARGPASIRRAIQLTYFRFVPKPRLFPQGAAGPKIAVDRKTSRKIVKRTVLPLDTTTTYFPMIEFLMGRYPPLKARCGSHYCFHGAVLWDSLGTRYEHSGIQHRGVC